MKTDKERTVEFLESLGVEFFCFNAASSIYITIQTSIQDIDFMFNEDGVF